MQEVVRRRYSRILEEQGELPDLILTDGGKGQMEVVRQVIEDELKLQIPIAGLAKNNKHRTSEVLFGFPPMTIGNKTRHYPLFSSPRKHTRRGTPFCHYFPSRQA